MKIEPEVLGLLIHRCNSGRMPEIYRESMRGPDPLLAIMECSALSLQWPSLYELLQCNASIDRARRNIAQWREGGIEVLAINHECYPPLLRTVFDPPPVLFVKGVPQALKFGFAIVGSRSADSMAFATARSIAAELVGRGATVVSGLAHGVDTAAHRGALEPKGALPTVAVFGTGLDKVYPRSNSELASAILDHGGALISQFEPGSTVYPSNFIARNRIISGMSRAVLVIQAAKNSGSLATARFALEEGRDVFVVPGPFQDPRYAGAHQLIRDGATVATDLDIVLEGYPELDMKGDPIGDREESPLLHLLREQESWGVEELVAELEIPRAELETVLLDLELKSLIVREPGNKVRVT